jgi:hypothetical protein
MIDKDACPQLDVCEPRAGEWFRVHPDPAHRREVTLLRDEDGTDYLVAPKMVAKVREAAPPDRVRDVMMFTAQSKDGETFLWPVTLPVRMVACEGCMQAWFGRQIGCRRCDHLDTRLPNRRTLENGILIYRHSDGCNGKICSEWQTSRNRILAEIGQSEYSDTLLVAPVIDHDGNF